MHERHSASSHIMTSKLPVRRHLNFNRLADELEAKLERTLNLRNDKIYERFSANFDGVQQPKTLPVEQVSKSNTAPKPEKDPPVIEPAIVISHKHEMCQTEPSEDDVDQDEETDGRHTQRVDRITRHNWRTILAERDEHIDKLIAHLDELHAHNKRFAAEHQQLLRRSCAACAEHEQLRDRLRSELERNAGQNQQLGHDVRMMKTLVYRLNVQLERHQDELRRLGAADEAFANAELAAAGPAAQPITASAENWGDVHAHTLAPLLHAYTAMIGEQRDLVAQYEQDAALFTGRLKEVLSENETLHSDMDRLRHESEAWQSDRTRLHAQLDIYRSKAEVQTRRADLAKQKLVEVLRCYEQKVQSQHIDLERLQEAYARTNGELTAVRSMQQNPEVVVESLRECQRLFEELKRQHDTERGKLVAEGEKMRERCEEATERARCAGEELAEVRAALRERDRVAESLGKKNGALRQSLGRVRLSREAFRTRLKQTGVQQQLQLQQHQQQHQQHQTAAAVPWSSADVDLMLREKTHQVQTEMHARYVDEIEKLTRKLQQRDETLRRVLQAKVRSDPSAGNVPLRARTAETTAPTTEL